MSGTIRFQADEDFRVAIVTRLRRKESNIDIQTTAEAGTLGLADPLVLANTAKHERILISHDLHTMAAHFDAFLASGHQSPGLLLSPQWLSIGQVIDELLLIWGASDPEEWRNLRRFLPL